jgi:hypothetical protein
MKKTISILLAVLMALSCSPAREDRRTGEQPARAGEATEAPRKNAAAEAAGDD